MTKTYKTSIRVLILLMFFVYLSEDFFISAYIPKYVPLNVCMKLKAFGSPFLYFVCENSWLLCQAYLCIINSVFYERYFNQACMHVVFGALAT